MGLGFVFVGPLDRVLRVPVDEENVLMDLRRLGVKVRRTQRAVMRVFYGREDFLEKASLIRNGCS
jgi:hypothetical protein